MTSGPPSQTESDHWEGAQRSARTPDADGWWEEPRRHSGPWGRRILVAVLVLVVLGLGGAVAAADWVNGHLDARGERAVVLAVPDQADHAQLTAVLAKAGVVSDGWLFHRYLDYRDTPPVRGGKYTFHDHEGYRQAMNDLGAGPQINQVRITVPEGYDLAETAAVVGRLPGLSAARFLALARSGAVRSPYEPPGINNLEGLLFPDTYLVDQGEDEQAILQTMVDRFDQVAAEVNLSASQATNGLTPYQTVVVASLIEREAKIDTDRAKIARVILNRLAKGMRLQIDATVEYAEGVHKDRLLNSDLKTPSPYNTYLVEGLPPGPIASPGRASLSAALQPAVGTWLYYVLINRDGQHGFATTAQQFDRLVAQARAEGL